MFTQKDTELKKAMLQFLTAHPNASRAQCVDNFPDHSQRTVERRLSELVMAGQVTRIGHHIKVTYIVADISRKTQPRVREFRPLKRDPFAMWRLREDPETSQAAVFTLVR